MWCSGRGCRLCWFVPLPSQVLQHVLLLAMTSLSSSVAFSRLLVCVLHALLDVVVLGVVGVVGVVGIVGVVEIIFIGICIEEGGVDGVVVVVGVGGVLVAIVAHVYGVAVVRSGDGVDVVVGAVVIVVFVLM